MVGIGRRALTSLIGGAAAWPIAPHAQEAGRIYRLGFLTARPRAIPEYDAFFDGLRHNGFIESQNLIVDARGFGLRFEQFAEIAAALVRSNPDVIFSAAGDSAMHALKAATQTVPIVGGAEDMVASGLVTSLSRPGRNITGLSPELDGKRLDSRSLPSCRWRDTRCRLHKLSEGRRDACSPQDRRASSALRPSAKDQCGTCSPPPNHSGAGYRGGAARHSYCS
jgi:hypothetical protein